MGIRAGVAGARVLGDRREALEPWEAFALKPLGKGHTLASWRSCSVSKPRTTIQSCLRVLWFGSGRRARGFCCGSGRCSAVAGQRTVGTPLRRLDPGEALRPRSSALRETAGLVSLRRPAGSAWTRCSNARVAAVTAWRAWAISSAAARLWASTSTPKPRFGATANASEFARSRAATCRLRERCRTAAVTCSATTCIAWRTPSAWSTATAAPAATTAAVAPVADAMRDFRARPRVSAASRCARPTAARTCAATTAAAVRAESARPVRAVTMGSARASRSVMGATVDPTAAAAAAALARARAAATSAVNASASPIAPTSSVATTAVAARAGAAVERAHAMTRSSASAPPIAPAKSVATTAAAGPAGAVRAA